MKSDFPNTINQIILPSYISVPGMYPWIRVIDKKWFKIEHSHMRMFDYRNDD